MFAMTSDIVAARSVPFHSPAAAPSTPTTEVAGTLAGHPITSCKTVIAKVIEVRSGSIRSAVQVSTFTRWSVTDVISVACILVESKWAIPGVVFFDMVITSFQTGGDFAQIGSNALVHLLARRSCAFQTALLAPTQEACSFAICRTILTRLCVALGTTATDGDLF